MPAFAPFRAYRYAPGTDLQTVIAPPYDVLSDEDIAELKSLDPNNITHIDVPAGGDLSRPGQVFSAHDDDLYARAAETLHAWLASGVLVQDEQPTFTIYRMSFTDATGTAREIAGVLGGLEVVDVPAVAGTSTVLPHERTTAKAVSDRLELTLATRTNLSPVWGLSLASGLTQALAAPGEFVGEMHTEGVVHRVERITDPARIAEISAILAADDVLIADGHHRYAISRTYRDEIRAVTRRNDTAAEYTLTFVNELIEEQLSIEAIHRLFTGICLDHLHGVLAEYFDITAIGIPAAELTGEILQEMETLGRLVLLKPDGSAEWLAPKLEKFSGVRALDGAYLEHVLASIEADPHGSEPQISYQHGLTEMVEKTASGQYTAGVLIRPTSLAEIRRTAREGLLMPPKSTFFTPKLRTGFVIRPTGINNGLTI